MESVKTNSLITVTNKIQETSPTCSTGCDRKSHATWMEPGSSSTRNNITRNCTASQKEHAYSSSSTCKSSPTCKHKDRESSDDEGFYSLPKPKISQVRQHCDKGNNPRLPRKLNFDSSTGEKNRYDTDPSRIYDTCTSVSRTSPNSIGKENLPPWVKYLLNNDDTANSRRVINKHSIQW